MAFHLTKMFMLALRYFTESHICKAHSLYHSFQRNTVIDALMTPHMHEIIQQEYWRQFTKILILPLRETIEMPPQILLMLR